MDDFLIQAQCEEYYLQEWYNEDLRGTAYAEPAEEQLPPEEPA